MIEFEENASNTEYLQSLVPFIITTKRSRAYIIWLLIKSKARRYEFLIRPYKSQWLSYDQITNVFKSKSQIKFVDIEDKLLYYIRPELDQYGFRYEDVIESSNIVEVYNKLLTFPTYEIPTVCPIVTLKSCFCKIY